MSCRISESDTLDESWDCERESQKVRVEMRLLGCSPLIRFQEPKDFESNSPLNSIMLVACYEVYHLGDDWAKRTMERSEKKEKKQRDHFTSLQLHFLPRDANEQFGIDFWLSIYKPSYQHSCVSIWKAKVTMEIKRGQWATEIRDDEAQGWCWKFIYKVNRTGLRQSKPSEKERNGN